MRTAVRISIDLPLSPEKAFDDLIEELVDALARHGIDFVTGEHGRLTEAEFEVARVLAWHPGERIQIQWHPAAWDPDSVTELEIRFQVTDSGTSVTFEQRGWGGLIGEGEEIAGWFAGEVAAPFLRSMAPASLGDWVTDRQARKPSGRQSRAVYRDPLYHYPNFRVILEELALQPDDYLLEVGCGGGALLKEALQSGYRAAAVDHSIDMVRLASAENAEAIADGRLEIRLASADRLPFADGTFTCALMTGVLGFLPNPIEALAELRRVLAPRGRIVLLGSDPELKGTPAAPEPMASRLRFYDDEELAELGRAAGFDQVRVIRRDLEAYAREVGIPEEHLALFSGPTSRFLLASRI